MQYFEGGSDGAGFPVWLASQDADKFLTGGTTETNFAELAECGIHFFPHVLTDAQQRTIPGGVTHAKFKKLEAAPAPAREATDGYGAAVLEGWWKVKAAEAQTRPAIGLAVLCQRDKR